MRNVTAIILTAAALVAAAPASASASDRLTYPEARNATSMVIGGYLMPAFTESPPVIESMRCKRVSAVRIDCRTIFHGDRLRATVRSRVRLVVVADRVDVRFAHLAVLPR